MQSGVAGIHGGVQAVSRTLAKVASLSGGDDGAVASTRLLARIDKQKFLTAVSRAAREEGAWIDDISEIAYAKYIIGTGQESVVYPSREPGYVVKINNFRLIDSERSPEDFFDGIRAYNELNPALRLDVIGFAENEAGDVCAVIRQTHVRARRHATQREIDECLKKFGFSVGRDRISGRITHSSEIVTITDAETRNVLVGDDGNLYFVDLIVDRNKGSAIAWKNVDGEVMRRATLTLDQLRACAAGSPEMQALVERIERGR